MTFECFSKGNFKMRSIRTIICLLIAAACAFALFACTPADLGDEPLYVVTEDAGDAEEQTGPAASLPIDRLSENDGDDLYFRGGDLDGIIEQLYGLFGAEGPLSTEGFEGFEGDVPDLPHCGSFGGEWSFDGGEWSFNGEDIDLGGIADKLREYLGDGFTFDPDGFDEDEIADKFRGYFGGEWSFPGDDGSFEIEDIDPEDIMEKFRESFGGEFFTDEGEALGETFEDKLRQLLPDVEIISGDEDPQIIFGVRYGDETFYLTDEFHILHLDSEGNSITGSDIDRFIAAFNERADALREFFDLSAGSFAEDPTEEAVD